MRQWYESAPLSNPDTPIGQLSASLQWADGHASEVRPIKWHLDGWGCAFFRVLEGLRQAEELRIQVTLGALLLADTLVQPSIGHRRLTEFENLHHYLSGGERLLTSDFLASRIFASYSRKDRWVVDAVESVLALLDSVHFVWDLRVLKAGELWNKRILRNRAGRHFPVILVAACERITACEDGICPCSSASSATLCTSCVLGRTHANAS